MYVCKLTLRGRRFYKGGRTKKNGKGKKRAWICYCSSFPQGFLSTLNSNLFASKYSKEKFEAVTNKEMENDHEILKIC